MKKKIATKRSQPTVAQPTAEAIAKRAHEIFVERGGMHGDDLAHWLLAESELKGDAKKELNQP